MEAQPLFLWKGLRGAFQLELAGGMGQGWGQVEGGLWGTQASPCSICLRFTGWLLQDCRFSLLLLTCMTSPVKGDIWRELSYLVASQGWFGRLLGCKEQKNHSGHHKSQNLLWGDMEQTLNWNWSSKFLGSSDIPFFPLWAFLSPLASTSVPVCVCQLLASLDLEETRLWAWLVIITPNINGASHLY